MRRPAILVLVAAALVAGCDFRPDHAEWQSQCVRSHDDLVPMPTMMPDGRGGMTTTITMMPQTQCDEYAPVCVPGKDGSTACPDLPETAR